MPTPCWRPTAPRWDRSTKGGAQAIQADRSFVWEMRTWARAVEAAGNRAYLYFFSQAPPVFRIYVPERPAIDLPDGPRGYGAYHSGDLAYVFANTRLVGIDWTDWDHELSDAMSQYWVNFARARATRTAATFRRGRVTAPRPTNGWSSDPSSASPAGSGRTSSILFDVVNAPATP